MDSSQQNHFNKLLSEGKRILVMFYTDWCPFCQKFKRPFESFANTSDKKIKFYAHMINDDDDPLWDRFSINAVPTLIAFDGDEIISRRDSKMGVGLNKTYIDSILKEIGEK
jgi:thiol-disulfide isomerase/thioredoxin